MTAQMGQPSQPQAPHLTLSEFAPIGFLLHEGLAMTDRVSLKIDLRSGVIEIDAPAESFQDAIKQTKELTASLDFAAVLEAPPSPVPTFSELATPNTQPSATQLPTKQSPSKKTKGLKTSSARPGRIGSFEEVRGLLTEPQEIDLRSFFAAKAPNDQTHQVIVAIVKGEELLGRKGFSYNEIYTLMWLGGVKDLPKAVDVVLGKLMQEQMVVREDTGFAAKFIGRNFVDQELPKAA